MLPLTDFLLEEGGLEPDKEAASDSVIVRGVDVDDKEGLHV